MKKLLVVFWVMLLISGLSLAQEGTWRTPRAIAWDNTPRDCAYPRILVDGNTVMVLYWAREGAIGNAGHLYFKKSTNCGITWQAPVAVIQPITDYNVAFENKASIIKEGNYIHVAFWGQIKQDNPLHTGIGLFVTRSTDGGNTWLTLQWNNFLFPGDGSGEGTPGIPQLAARNGGAIIQYIALDGSNPPRSQIYWFLYTDGGSWIDQTYPLTNNTRGTTINNVFAASYPSTSTIYEIWQESNGNVYYNYSTDNGGHWQSTDQLLTSNPPGFRINPYLVPRWNGSALEWFAFFSSDISSVRNRIFCQKITSGMAVNLSPWPSDKQTNYWNTRACVDPTWNDPRVVWWEYSSSEYTDSLKYDFSTDVGSTWWYWTHLNPQDNFLVSPSYPATYTVDMWPDIGAGPGIRQVVWNHEQAGVSNQLQVWYRKNSDDNVAPSAPTNLQGWFLTFPQYCAYLQWNLNTEPDVACYQVFRSTDGTRFSFIGYGFPGPGGANKAVYYDYTVQHFQQYWYYVEAEDYAENLSGPSNTVHLVPGPGGLNVDAGTPEGTPYTVQRSGYFAWGNTPDKTVDIDPVKLIYRFSGLDTSAQYVLGVVYYAPLSEPKREVSLSVDGITLHRALRLPEEPYLCAFQVPPEATSDGVIEVDVNRESGPSAACAGLCLVKLPVQKGGPQSYGEASRIPSQTLLGPAVPNPCTAGASWRFSLSHSGPVSLKVYDASGRFVRTIVEGDRVPGSYSVNWDGKNVSGQKVSSGVYFIRLKAGDFESTRRLVVTR